MDMKLATWNIRRMGTNVKLSAIGRLVRMHKIDMILIQETKKSAIKESEIRRCWGDDEFDFCFVESDGSSGGLLSVWDKGKFVAESKVLKSNFILVCGHWEMSNEKFSFINIYAPCTAVKQKELWNELSSRRINDNSIWIAAGDFNATMCRGERRGCRGSHKGSLDFKKFYGRLQFGGHANDGENVHLL
ncbi:hypothetical protein V6N13_094607 [Hibiscus sabdariffa]